MFLFHIDEVLGKAKLALLKVSVSQTYSDSACPIDNLGWLFDIFN